MISAIFLSTSAFAENLFFAKTQAPWQKKEPLSFEIQGDKTEKVPVVFSFKATPDTFYRFTFQVSTNSPCRIVILTTQEKCASYVFIPVKKNSHFATVYFYSQNGKPIIGRLFLDQQNGPVQLAVKNFQLQSLSEADLKKNLFPNGNFENEAGADFLKTNSNNSKPVIGEIVPSPNFFEGEKSFEMAFGHTVQENKLASHYLPMIPGKRMELKFWAKSTGEEKLTVIMNTIPRNGIMHKGKHLYINKPLTIDGEWHEYTLLFQPGADFDNVPDLKQHLLKLQFFAPEKSKGKIWLDNLDYRILD